MRIVSVVLLLAAVFLLSHCDSDNRPRPTPILGVDELLDGNEDVKNAEVKRVPAQVLALKKNASEDCDNVRQYVADSLLDRYTKRVPYLRCGISILPQPYPVLLERGGVVDSGVAFDVVSAAPGSISTGDQQTAGVQEGDIVKVDNAGTFYIINQNRFFKSDIYPPKGNWQVQALQLPELVHPTALYLDKDRDSGELPSRALVVAQERLYYIAAPAAGTEPTGSAGVSRQMLADVEIAIYPPPRFDPKTVVYIVNFADAGKPPFIEDKFTLSGNFMDARVIGERFHWVNQFRVEPPAALDSDPEFCDLVMQYHNRTSADFPPIQELDADFVKVVPPPVDKGAIKVKIREKIEMAIDAVGVKSLLPRSTYTNMLTKAPTVETPFACETFHRPDLKLDLNLKVVQSMDTSGDNVSSATVVNNAYILYFSQNNLYLAENSTSWWWPLDASHPSHSALYKLSLHRDGPARFEAVGRFDGRILNSFNMDEYQGHVRLATMETVSFRFIIPTVDFPIRVVRSFRNHIFVLKDNGAGALELVGQARNYAVDVGNDGIMNEETLGNQEQLRASRFIGNKGYAITAAILDPMFVFDMSDPLSPEKIGQSALVPGFGTYIRPIDQNYVISIGYANNRRTGIKLTLWDAKSGQQVAGNAPDSRYSGSSALYDHRAFTYSPETRLLSIPGHFGSQEAAGALIYSINTSSPAIKFVGKVTQEAAPGIDPMIVCITSPCAPAIQRTAILTGADARDIYIYTMSAQGVRATLYTGVLPDLFLPLQQFKFNQF